MSSKEDNQKTMHKLKQFLKSVGRNTGGNSREERDQLSGVESELRPETPVAHRCKTLKDLGEQLRSSNLEEPAVAKLWELTKDLIVDNKSSEYRQVTLNFYKILIQTQYLSLTVMREHFFHVIQNHEVPEDLRHRLDLLIALTENGKNITHFEEKIGKFMLLWLPAIRSGDLLDQYLELLGNLIKFNASHLDNEILIRIVENACQLSWTVDKDEIGLQCLNILEQVMCYTIFPEETLELCVMTLCRTVNNTCYCKASWKNMKNLLGTNLGYSALFIMCNIPNDKMYYNDANLLRGAVFYINMGIFGPPPTMAFPPEISTTSFALTSFLNALKSKKLIVTYEVILSIKNLITNYGKKQPERIWDIICEILSSIADNIAYYEAKGEGGKEEVHTNFHNTIDLIEELMQSDELLANKDLIYDLIESVAESRPEVSVLNLIDYRSEKISGTKPEWLVTLNNFVSRFYRIPNTNIREKTIHSLKRIMDANRVSYEEEILQRVVIPQFGDIHNEPDIYIRVVVCKALVEFALHYDTKRSAELIDILEKVLNRPFALYAADESVCKSEVEIQDVSAVVDGLIKIFISKLYRLSSTYAVKVFNILVGHLELHYQQPKVFQHVNLIRSKIFAWMLRVRANASYHIGYPDPETGAIRFSPYLGIDSTLQPHSASGHSINQEPIVISSTTISIRRACKLIVKCVEEDKDYHVFQLVVKELPQILQNKALILGNDMESLASALCNALPDTKSTLRSFLTTKPSSDDFNALLLPAIASLVIYHQYISSDLKLRMIEAVKVVLRSNANAHICISTLSIMILEMPETLSRQLAEVLLEISKMSRTASVAIPILEFLSILSRLPNDLFANFVPTHYMYVFAVSLSYTKPHPYDHYTVSLAYHVMTGWLLKCKMSMRKNFVMYIISGLQTDANLLTKDHSLRNEDSSSRQRSTSLTERVSRNRDSAFDLTDNLKSIQTELAETCIDFLARHTFSPCSTLPKRLPAVECMLKDGPSQTWLVGHNLVTITTNGCPSPPKANGLCDRCSLLINKSNSPFAKSDVTGTPNSYAGGPISPEIVNLAGATGPVESTVDVQPPNRRYTKASLQYSSGTESGTSTDLTSTSTSSSSQHQTHRQTSNSSSVSLEALSRRGSNPEPENRIETSSALGNSLNQLSNASSGTTSQQPTCARSCTGWAEIYIRRPTGNISWIMHIQNPIANDCLGSDLPLSDLITLFLPTMHGGVFGPDFVGEAKLLSPAPPLPTLSPREPVEQERRDHRRPDAAKLAVAKVRALQRQEEVTSAASASGPIDIPKSGKRGKDPSSSLSDGEADEEGAAFEDGRTRARNPVRRVNSSPEMSSSLKKQAARDFNTPGPLMSAQLDQDEASKKKIVVSSGYTKDIRVSCEAIPEEIAGSTPPSQADSLKDDDKRQTTNEPPKKALEISSISKEPSLPPKQHSADDVTNQMSLSLVTGSASATNLKIPLDLQKIGVKPPQTNAPLSPRLLAKNAAIKIASFSSNVGMNEYNNGDMIRGRSKTISVVREVDVKSRPPLAFPSFGAAKAPMNSKLGINPSFVFLQLFHNGQLQPLDPPLKVGADNMATITVLDLIPPFETHKFGVLYVGQGQCNNEVEILRNRYGSVRYVEFLRSMGTLVSLKDAKENNLFVNMDTNGSDGNFTYIWKDDVVQITFHVATLMPNHENDPNCTEKKKHIGNDYVSIVYNESGEEYNLNTIKGQFNYACVVVQPLELNMNRVFVKARHEIAKFVCHSEPKIVSDRSAPLLARQLALHANLASHVYQSMKSKNPYASNWLERLRKIKNLRTKLLNEGKQKRDAGKDEPSSWW